MRATHRHELLAADARYVEERSWCGRTALADWFEHGFDVNQNVYTQSPAANRKIAAGEKSESEVNGAYSAFSF